MWAIIPRTERRWLRQDRHFYASQSTGPSFHTEMLEQSSSFGGCDYVPCKPRTTGGVTDQGPQLCSEIHPHVCTEAALPTSCSSPAGNVLGEAIPGRLRTLMANSAGVLFVKASSVWRTSEPAHPVVSLLWVPLASWSGFPSRSWLPSYFSHVFNPILVSDS